jgi:hypothetical protein
MSIHDDHDDPRAPEPGLGPAIDAIVREAARLAHPDGGHGHVSARRIGLIEDMVRTSLRTLGDGSDLGR